MAAELMPEPEPEPEPELMPEEFPVSRLLPAEQRLAPALAAIAAARSRAEHAEADRLTVEMLTAHDLTKVSARPGPPAGALPAGLEVSQSELQLDVYKFGKWLRTAEGRPWLAVGKGPSDDGLYTVSQLLRTHMPRGLSWFEISEPQATAGLAVRGFKKFTGLESGDEDEESGATENSGLFMYDGRSTTDAARVVVTTKSNGENGKWAIRRSPSGAHTLCFAGSKHATRVWSADVDPQLLYPLPAQEYAYVPADTIVHAMHSFLAGMEEATRTAFIEMVADNSWTLMLEYNSRLSEHVFPIENDFVDFVAVLDQAGVPIAQAEAFAFFDRFGLPRVDCVSHPIAELEAVVESVRSCTDNEGAVIYLEDSSDACIGLVKVKTDHYVIARRIRQTFWGALINPLLSGKLSDGPVPCKAKGGGGGSGGGKDKASTIAEALRETEQRLRNGMRALTHVGGCEEKWEQWYERAMLFVQDFHMQYDALPTAEAKRELAEESKRKFGTMYASLCRRSESPGYKMAQLELVRTTTALHEHPRWEEYAELTEKLRERALAIAGLKGAVEAAHDNHKKQKGLGAKVTEYEAQCRAMEMQAADAKDAMAAEWSAHECAVEALRVILRPTE